MKALLLMLGGGILIAVAFAQLANWGTISFFLILIGIAVGIWGLVANHRDHIRK